MVRQLSDFDQNSLIVRLIIFPLRLFPFDADLGRLVIGQSAWKNASRKISPWDAPSIFCFHLVSSFQSYSNCSRLSHSLTPLAMIFNVLLQRRCLAMKAASCRNCWSPLQRSWDPATACCDMPPRKPFDILRQHYVFFLAKFCDNVERSRSVHVKSNNVKKKNEVPQQYRNFSRAALAWHSPLVDDQGNASCLNPNHVTDLPEV